MSNLDDLVFGTRKYHKDLLKICEPFHRLFGTNHVGYLNIDNNGGLINLHTHAKWLDRCVEEKYYLQDPCMVTPKNIESGHAFYFTYEEDEFTDGILKDSMENFNMAHELVFVNKHDHGFDVIGITAPLKHTAIYNKIVRNYSHIGKFLDFFRQNLEPLLNKLEAHKIDLSALKGDRFHQQTALITNLSHEQNAASILNEHCNKQSLLTV